jgi:hypothetical protein
MTQWLSRRVGLLACAGLLACGSSRSGNPNEADDAGLGHAVLFAPDVDAAMAGRAQANYSLIDQRDIIAMVPVPATTGEQLLRLDITQPVGTPYKTIWRAFSADPDAPETITHPTYNQEVAVEQVVSVAGSASVLIAIPIAGTNIAKYKLTGVFSVAASLGADDSQAFVQGQFEMVAP